MISIVKLAQESKYVGSTFTLSIGLFWYSLSQHFLNGMYRDLVFLLYVIWSNQTCWLIMIVDSFCV
ncbi:hypothetical protein F383_01266 [Gossypium arboreum]|uniref:Uncharacterized protein n=1 Tax=Gossypium arboreum TaxID=29729 RepID=A0A0B0PJZ4_GOSAR|nr:hypothetical protein F383_01266 [Gossypium arboreum]